MNGTGLGVGLATMVHTLDGRRMTLLAELRQVEQDIENVKQTVGIAERLGFGNMAPPAAPVTAAPPVSSGAPEFLRPRQAATQASSSQPPPQTKRDFDVHLGALRSLGPVRDDRNMPPKVNKRGRKVETLGMPTGGAALQAIRDSLNGICEAVAKEPPGPGDRRHSSKQGLVMGDPVLPIVRQILQAADRPLTSLEVGVAFLEVRGLELDGKRLTALVNRISAKLSNETKQGRVQRLRTEGRKLVSWVWAKEQPQTHPLQEQFRAYPSSSSSQPSGSTG